ncbi:MAG: SxtJ family membrane protein [Candidatus Binataceae bacterium]|jgi:fatty acid desaturase
MAASVREGLKGASAAKPNPSELRKFGLVLGAMFAGFFGVMPLLRHHPMRLWPWPIAAALWLAALLRPSLLRYLYFAWTRLGLALGWLNTSIILTLIYALLIVPIGWLMRLFGRDRMGRRYDPAAASYRIPSHQRPAKNMERPF